MTKGRRRGTSLIISLAGGVLILLGCTPVPIPTSSPESITPTDHQESLTPTRPEQPSPATVDGIAGDGATPAVEKPNTIAPTEELKVIPTWPASTSVPDRYAIELQVGTIDTREGVPPLPEALRLDKYQPGEDGYYVVQFVDVILPEWRNRLDDIGVERLGYVPNNAFLVRMTHAEREIVAGLDVVQWIGIYQPAYKISPALPKCLEGESVLTVIAFPGVDIAGIETKVRDWGGTIEASSKSQFEGKVRVTIDLSYVPRIARLKGVMWIEPWVEPGLSTVLWPKF